MEITDILKQRMREKILKKNSRRSSHFLSLSLNEIFEVIDDFFDS